MNNHKHAGMVALTAFVSILIAACAATPSQRSAGQTVDDSVLVSKVKAELIKNDQTKARQIDVEVYKGDVQLNGFVDNNDAKMAAARTAKNVAGVKSVQNNLQIRDSDRTTGQAVDDALITTRVKTALIGDPRTKATQIEVTTNSGMVQLGGFVDDSASKAAAAELARAVDGVKGVKNEIEIRQ